MAMTAWEIKNKYIYTLNKFTQDEIEKEWKCYMKEMKSTNEEKFVDWLRQKFGNKVSTMVRSGE